MIDRDHDLSVARQAKALGISRGSVYYRARPASDADLALMRRIDELHLEYPFAGSRMLKGLLNAEGHAVGRRRVATLMKKMGIEALYRRPLAMSCNHWRTRLAVEACAGAQGLPLLAPQVGDHPARPGLGDGHHVHPDGPRSPWSLEPVARHGSPSTSRR